MIEALSNQNTPRVVVSDLDAILSEPVFFKLHGKEHEIKPISTAVFLKFTQALNDLLRAKDSKTTDENEAIDVTTHIIQSVAPSVTRVDIEDCTAPQIFALFQLILDSVAGRVQGEAKKKTQLRLMEAQAK